jgi:L-cysteine desulfidase
VSARFAEARPGSPQVDDELLAIVRDNVEGTLGCTDPITPGLAAAAAVHGIGGTIQRIRAVVSRDIFKGAFNVGVPPTGLAGIRIALLLGAAIGDPRSGLMLFGDATEEHVTRASRMLSEVEVEVLVDGNKAAIYAHVEVWTSEGVGHATVQGRHDAIVASGSGEARAPVFASAEQAPSYAGGLTMLKTVALSDLVDFAQRVTVDDLEPVRRGIEMNSALAIGAEPSGGLGSLMADRAEGLGDECWIEHAKALVATGTEARMTGRRVPVMAVFGSGNQGIVLFAGLHAVGRARNLPADRVIRAGGLAVLLAGALNAAFEAGSPFCDCVLVACPALAGAATWLFGGDVMAISQAVATTAAAFSGLLCDGAKPGCAFRAAMGTGVALETANLVTRSSTAPAPAALGEGDWRRMYADLACLGTAVRDSAEDALVDVLRRGPPADAARKTEDYPDERSNG